MTARVLKFSGEKLREARELLGLSRMDLIRRLLPMQMNPQSIVRYESGEAIPGADRLLALAEALGIKVEDLFDVAD